MISLKNFTVKAGEKIILKNINYSFKKNKVYCLMGPNGSGKSTFAYAIAGHPGYELDEKSKIYFEKQDITDLSSDKRAKKGIFLSFQTPLSLNGVNVFQLLRLALSGIKDPLKIKKEIEIFAKKLNIKKELIERSLNDGASGGEKKKLEMLQAAIINPKFLILDEVDTGVDVDALRSIGRFLDEFKKEKTIVLITHYSRILKYINPDKVLIIIDGKIQKEGAKELVKEIEDKGYGKTN
ncbi:MAG: Fe-S cluster assembly ATPase SufC [Patescibacteria group bacterium]|nr:Fe-S cluster assembly ATPase SufC [Patescibacteria group bacterium]